MNEDLTIDSLKTRIHELEREVRDYKQAQTELRASRRRYAALIDTLPHGIQEFTVDGIITFSNKAHHRMSGYAEGELLGKHIWDLVADEAEQKSLPGLLKQLATEQPPPHPFFTQNMNKDGRRIDVQVDWNYKRDSQGRVIGFISVITDISSRLAASRALQESEQRYRALFEKAGDAIFLLAAEESRAGRIIDTNQAAADMHGYSLDEISRLNIQDLNSPLDAHMVGERFQRMLAGEWIQDEITHRKKDGSIFPVEISAGLVTIGDKKAILAFDRDITVRKLAEQRLIESEERYRAIFEGSREGILLADIETLQLRFANPAICNFLGYTREELVRMRVPDIHPPADRDRVLAQFQAQANAENILAEQIPCRHKAGHAVYADIRAGSVHLDGRSFMVGFFTDISEELGIKKALKEQVLFLQTLIDTLPHPIFYKDGQGRYLGCNTAFEHFIGMRKDELVGKSVYEIASKELADIYHAADQALFQSRKPQVYEASVRYADGTQRSVIFNKAVFYHQDGSVAGLVGAMLDITDRKRADEEKALREKQLRQSQKLEAIGTLAGGIAHDFNNILSAIVGYTEIALHDLPPETQTCDYLKKVLKAGDRARNLVNQILAFSRSTEQESRPVVIRHIAKEVLKLLQATLPSTIRITSELESEAAIMADPTQIHQVLMNLCTNAAHAMQAGGGRLSVILREAVIDETRQEPPGLKPGPYLKLTVRDTGCGIQPEFIDRIFDPFFTTKKLGEGTGMGLAMVHGIVKECGGSIQVNSMPAQGATFDIWLPVIEAESDPPSPKESPLPVGHENILFVDDEPDLVDIGLQMLELLGYQATAINDSQQALETFSRAPGQFDLVITDLTMPHLTGDQLSRHLLAIRPDLPIIICTGYSDRIHDNSRQSMGETVRYARKPLILKDLSEIIRQALDGRG